MEQLKVRIDQMVNQLKQRSLGQSNVDLFEMIGKLEQAKSYLLAEAMRTFDPLPSGFFDGLPTDFQQAGPVNAPQFQQPAPRLPQPTPMYAPRLQQPTPMYDPRFQQPAPTYAPPLLQAAPRLQQAAHVADGQQVSVFPQAAQVGDDYRWMYLWDPSDEHRFVPVTHLPIPWFTTMLTKSAKDHGLEINDGDTSTLMQNSPPKSFLNSPKFCSVGMPVTLTSSKLLGLGNMTTCPGLLIGARQGMGLFLYWPTLGHKFPTNAIIRLSFQWKVFGSKYKLFITINEEVSEPVGTSNRSVGRKRRYYTG
ncbi:uncharacterized protein LOC129902573 isoform X2 [Solanum dulcamara]|nr:uncharacterized protein LOC129902573 isoform X2 [Solanum dulcamara]